MTDRPEFHECETTAGWERWRNRPIPDGRMLALEPLLMPGYFRLHVVRNAHDLGSMECFDYQDPIAALDAFTWWEGEGEPEGWYRHRPSNRRRPDGDPEREYIEP